MRASSCPTCPSNATKGLNEKVGGSEVVIECSSKSAHWNGVVVEYEQNLLQSCQDSEVEGDAKAVQPGTLRLV